MPNQEELDRLAEDLKFIKTAIQKSGSIIRRMTWKAPIRWIALAGGLAFIVVALVVNWLEGHYGGFDAVPTWGKVIFFGCIALSIVLIAVWKLRTITRQLRKTGNEVTYRQLVKEVYTRHVLVFFIPLLCTVAGTAILLSMRGLGFYIVPATAVLLGLAVVFFAIQFRFKEMFATSFWMIATGFICLFLDTVISPMGALAFTYGGSMIFLFLITLFPGEAEGPGDSRG